MNAVVRWSRRILLTLVSAVAAALVIGLVSIEFMEARQRAATRIETPNGIESLEFVELGGVPQSILLRGQDRDNPILLFVHGGPGAPTTALARDYSLQLEAHFVVVHWDQRGAGNSCSSDVPDESLHLEQYLSDTHELVERLRARFDEDKIFLVGHSWGSVLGVMTAKRHPELFHAYVGLGQVVNMLRNEEISYQFVVDRAKAEGNDAALEELASIRPPYTNRADLLVQRKWLGHYRGDHLAGNAMSLFARAVTLSPEYGFRKKLSFYRCAMKSIDLVWPELNEIDLQTTAARLDLPVFFFAGRHDYNTPFVLVEGYFDVLDAPHKELIWFENSAHSPNIEEPDRFQAVMIDRVLGRMRGKVLERTPANVLAVGETS